MRHAQIERLRELHGRMTDYKNSAQFGADRSRPLEVDALLELIDVLLNGAGLGKRTDREALR